MGYRLVHVILGSDTVEEEDHKPHRFVHTDVADFSSMLGASRWHTCGSARSLWKCYLTFSHQLPPPLPSSIHAYLVVLPFVAPSLWATSSSSARIPTRISQHKGHFARKVAKPPNREGLGGPKPRLIRVQHLPTPSARSMPLFRGTNLGH